MNRLTLIACLAAASLALAACEQKSDAPTPPSTAPTGAAAQGDVPTEQDYEDEAEKDITASNMDGELDKLEKEIGQ